MLLTHITITGAHTIGDSHCSSFVDRLYKRNATFSADPTLDPKYARKLRKLCASSPDPNVVVPMDPHSPRRFDNSYYFNVKAGRGLFASDSSLYKDDARSRAAVLRYSVDADLWLRKFARSMIKMGSIPRPKGEGEIRKNCRVVNPPPR